MRWVRVGLLAGLAAKAVIVGAWWWTSVARAEHPVAEAPVAPDLFARSRGFRELLEAVRQRGEELDRREQALATREAAVKALEQALAETAWRARRSTRACGRRRRRPSSTGWTTRPRRAFSAA